MKVSVIQMDMAFLTPEENYQKAEQMIRRACSEERPDVLLLPETWNTGFYPHQKLSELCDKNGERTKAAIGALAKELKVNIVAGSITNEKGGRLYNTALIFDRAGQCIAEYDKIHLFSPMREDVYYAKGSEAVTFTLDGVLCGIVTCYDIRFLELTRMLALKGIQILFVPAQWPDTRIMHWDTLNLARAIENQIFVVCCNSCGRAGKVQYAGHSKVIDPKGAVLKSLDGAEGIISAELDFSALKEMRETISVFADRRPDVYKLDF